MRKTFPFILAFTIILTLCCLFSACEKSYDEMMYDFYGNSCDGQFNAIKISLGNNMEAIYFIEQHYGIWSHNGEDALFNIERTLVIHRGGDLIIKEFSDLSYYKAIVEYSNPKATGYYGDTIFSGYAQFSEEGTIATFLPKDININEMSSVPESTVIMTKIKLTESEIISFDEALNKMNFVPDTYIDFVSERNGWKFSCKLANLWVDGSTMTGEWSTNGSVIPIRMKLHEKVPYVEIYDISDSSEKLILKSYATVVDEYSIELVAPEGTVFYTTPTSPVIVTKTN